MRYQRQQLPPSPSSPFHPNCLNGKAAIITGGGSGIGFEITRQLLLHGLKGAVIVGRREVFLRRACDELNNEANGKVLYYVCDVRNIEQCQKAVEYAARELGRLDILVNGAAGNFLANASQLSSKGFATVMNIDAVGTFNMCNAAYPYLRKQSQDDDPVIINISATLQYGATWYQCHASAAKSAIDSLTRSLALEWGCSDNIRVVGIAPGPIANTPGTAKLAPTTGSDGNANTLLRKIPLQRMGEAYEIGQAAVYLATAKYVTGHILVVDGGEWLYRDPIIPNDLVSKLSRQVEAKSRAMQQGQTHTKSKL